ncbi:unnamed protein product [Schistosoma curassoni]|uniref:Ovule protein n=1 Tax=Schistosoma curassoni TaxID=6186 RepID=A0A183KZQ2_9TREM|nr:unnamed protein product [Schistosoma curassoni]
MIARRIGTINWVLLRDKINEMNDRHEKEANPHTIRAQIIASQLQNMSRETTISHTKHEDGFEKCTKEGSIESTDHKGGPYTKGMTPEERKQFFRTKLNQKAREGFRFWVTERPKPTKCKRKHLSILILTLSSNHLWNDIFLYVYYYTFIYFCSVFPMKEF